MAKLERVGADHPEACQGNTGNGPCSYKAETPSRFCSLHGGAMAAVSDEKVQLRAYKLNAIHGERARAHSSNDNVKNLAVEISLLKTTLESVWNGLATANDMLIHSDKIEKLTTAIGKLVVAWQKVQEQNKELLGRETVLALFDALMEKIVEHVEDPDVIRKLAEEGHGILTRGLGCANQ